MKAATVLMITAALSSTALASETQWRKTNIALESVGAAGAVSGIIGGVALAMARSPLLGAAFAGKSALDLAVQVRNIDRVLKGEQVIARSALGEAVYRITGKREAAQLADFSDFYLNLFGILGGSPRSLLKSSTRFAFAAKGIEASAWLRFPTTAVSIGSAFESANARARARTATRSSE